MPISLEKLENIWSKLEARVMIMVSLLLQTTLIVFGSKRKSTRARWIMSLVWLSYLLADNVATLSLGFLIRSMVGGKGRCSPKYSSSNTTTMPLSVFWSPFLLLHLGGPDTITAYSRQDSELWLRHFFGLVIQVVTVIYGLFSYWNISNILSFLTIPIFISGLLKYGEKTWVLMSSSSQPLVGPSVSEDGDLPLSEKLTPDAKFLHIAYSYVKEFRSLVNGQILNETYRSHLLEIPFNEAFKLVEVELGLVFDLVYTKTRVIYSASGVLFRFITFLSIVSTLAIFCTVTNKHPYLGADVVITMFLLVGAIALEVYAAFTNIFSDWTLMWLTKQKKSCCDLIFRAVSSSCLCSLCNKNRYPGSMGQLKLSSYWSSHSVLLKYVNYDKPCAFCFALRTQWLVTNAHVTDELRERIFRRLKEYDLYDFYERTTNKVIYTEVQQDNFDRYEISDVVANNFDIALLNWHVATQLIYDNSDLKKEGLAACVASKLLADYMLYLQVVCPFLLPKSVIRATELGDAVVESKVGNKGRDLCKRLLSLMQEGKMTKEDMWEMVCEVWVSILIYAAAKCRWEEQIDQLSRGGEFLTYVWLLTLHLGLADDLELVNPNEMEKVATV